VLTTLALHVAWKKVHNNHNKQPEAVAVAVLTPVRCEQANAHLGLHEAMDEGRLGTLTCHRPPASPLRTHWCNYKAQWGLSGP